MSKSWNEFLRLEKQGKQASLKKDLLLEEMLRSPDPEILIKANNYLQERLDKQENSRYKSYIIDPGAFQEGQGFMEKRSTIGYTTLRAMSYSPIPRAIVETRKEQVVVYSRPQQDKYSPGYIIRPKQKMAFSDEEVKLTKAQMKEIEELHEWLWECGVHDFTWHGDNFESWIRKVVDDSLCLDQVNSEIVFNMKGEAREFFCNDASTFRYIQPMTDEEFKNRGIPKVNGYYPSYVQLYDGQIWDYFYPHELTFGIRNPSSNIYRNGYGRSELENLISTVTAMLNADQMNSKIFSYGSAPKGILRVQGNINPNTLAEFRRHWTASVSGVRNAWKTPILEADKVDWVDMHKSHRDMEYAKYQEYLIRVACAAYKIAPDEIGFDIKGENSSSLSQGSNEHEHKYSRDRGLKPLLKFIENMLNRYIFSSLMDGRYEFKYVGMDSETAAQEEERLIKACGGAYMEVNEVRKIKGLPTKPGYDVIANPATMAIQQMEMEKDMMDDQQSHEMKMLNDEQDHEKVMNVDDDNPFAKGAMEFVKTLS